MIAEADVVVVGAGPAGLAAAIVLSSRGWRTLVVGGTRTPRVPWGETLAPAGAGILRELGAWPRNEVPRGHDPCWRYEAAWGGERAFSHDHLLDARGTAWLIDRPLMTEQMRDRVLSLSATIRDGEDLRLTAVETNRAGWRWTGRLSSGAAWRGRFVVDASGRTASFARSRGARRMRADGQTATMVRSTRPAASPDGTVCVEAVADGWWYSAQAPDGHLVATYFSDADLFASPRDRAALMARASLGLLTSARLRGAPSVWSEARTLAASEVRTMPWVGEGWLAVGDAAFATDPLSGHGLTLALATGRDGALTVDAILRQERLVGARSALTEYGARLGRVHALQGPLRRVQYKAEGRWPDHPYWSRRRNDGPLGTTPVSDEARRPRF